MRKDTSAPASVPGSIDHGADRASGAVSPTYSLDVPEVMRKVRAEISRIRGPQGGPGENRLDFSPWTSAPAVDTGKRQFFLEELLAPSDAAFVDTAFRVLLRRNADPGGREHFLSRLRSGALSKVEVLGAIRWSPEGLSQSVHVDGLLLPYKLRQWQRKRVIGPLIAWISALARLGTLPHEMERVDSVAAHNTQELGRVLNTLGAHTTAMLAEVEAMNAELRERLEAHERRITLAQGASEQALKDATECREKAVELAATVVADQASVAARLGSMQSHLDTLREFPAAVVAAQQSIEMLDKRHAEALGGIAENATLVGQLEERLQAEVASLRMAQDATKVSHDERLVAQAQEVAVHGAVLHQHGVALGMIEEGKAQALEAVRALDPMYAAFEAKFRGEASLVRTRMEPYVAHIAGANAGTADAPVVDVGCGRGEWLDVLREHNLAGRGIDSNRIFVEMCRGKGLDVIEGDAIDVLKGLPDKSAGAVTAMHIAEHLPFEVLVRMLDEALRILVPGGLLILETPNPENLSVATQSFYLDPTHRNPLPPEALRWIVEARGFDQVTVERLALARDTNAPPLLDQAIPGADSVNVLLAQLAVAPDYAVVARRRAR